MVTCCSVFLLHFCPSQWPFTTSKQGHVCCDSTSLFLPHERAPSSRESLIILIFCIAVGIFQDSREKPEVGTWDCAVHAGFAFISLNFKLVWVHVVMWHSRTSAMFLLGQTNRTISEFLKCAIVHTWDYCLSFMVYELLCPIIYGIRFAYCKGGAVASIIYFAFYISEGCNTNSTNKYILFCSCLSLCYHFCYT